MAKNVLIVDDSATLRSSVDYTLSAAGYKVFQAVDGRDGLDKLESMQGSGEPAHMIISDVNMPVMDGITFIREVKKTAWRFLPILVLTTESEDARKREGKAAGASGWLVKPFKPETLVAVVRKFVR